MPEPERDLALAWRTWEAGRREQAMNLCREILSRQPWSPQANSLLGVFLLQGGDPRKALRYIRRALKSEPDDAQAQANLGIALKDLGRMRDAADAFARACELDPGNLLLTASHGNALRLAGAPHEAVNVLENAYRQASANENVRQNLALAQNDLGARENRSGNPTKAAVHFARALDLDPGLATAQLNLGLTLEQAGKLDEAERHYRAAIACRPGFADAHFHLAHLRTHRSNPDEIDVMKRLFSETGTARDDRIKLAYGLGFALESADQFEQAFGYMREAHRLQSQTVRFDLSRKAREFERISEIFSVSRLSVDTAGHEDPRPVFICGMPRSGTTLTEQVLASHGDVQGMGEQVTLAAIANRLCNAEGMPFPEGLARLRPEGLREAGQHYLDAVAPRELNVIRFTDTTPMNFRMLGLAALMFPKARFILCLREPRDNCLSLFRQMLTGANDYAHTLEHLGGYYRLHLRLVHHWEETLGDRLHLLKYEDLVEHTEPQVRRLLEFCELDFDPNCMLFHESDRHVTSPSAAQVRQPVYSSSIGAWKRYRNHLSPLIAALEA